MTSHCRDKRPASACSSCGEIVERNQRTAAQGSDERAQLPLFLQHQLLQLFEFRFDVAARGSDRPFHRLEPEGRTGEELNDAVMQVAGERQPRTGLGVFFGCLEQGVALNMDGNVGGDLMADVDKVGRKIGYLFKEQFAFAPVRTDRNCEPFAETSSDIVSCESDCAAQVGEVAVRIAAQAAVPRQVIEEWR